MGYQSIHRILIGNENKTKKEKNRKDNDFRAEELALKKQHQQQEAARQGQMLALKQQQQQQTAVMMALIERLLPTKS